MRESLEQILEDSRSDDVRRRRSAARELCPCELKADHPEAWSRVFELTRDDDACRRDTRHQVGTVAGHDVETLCEFFDTWGGQVDLRVGGTGGRQRRRIDCRARSRGLGLTRGRGRDARPRGCQGNAQCESQPVSARRADFPARVTALVSWCS